MTVDIQENLLPEEEYEKKDDTVSDIVAAKDRVISEIVTRTGTPLVAAGSEVKKGDILVSGRIEIQNDDGETSEYLYNSADADVKAKVVYSYEDVIKTDYVESVPTKNQTTNYEATVFYSVFGNPFWKNPYQDYEVTSDTYQVHVADNFYLPIWLTKQDYQEVKKVNKKHTEREIRQIATKNLDNYLKDLEEKGIQIIGKNVIIRRTGENYVASGTIEVYESIVSYQPTEIINITSEERQNVDESD